MLNKNITIVVATAENWAIGKNNDLLWHLPADLKHFKALTTGKPIIMGRKTFESIGRALPNRTNIVITSQDLKFPEGVIAVKSLNEAITICADAEEICIIGGGKVYEQALPLANKIELTTVHGVWEADVYFPEISFQEWEVVKKHHFYADESNAYDYTFSTLIKK
ncbi:dihydrofolate reductase [Pedobacter flavus]|uniref:Dihydrofolate reductase n=1 Tax=Pedobacter flavus TaxID=3113906 RepID=A0ABU7H1T2_9SPHI|nr:dihydrofolate reductase [Pedobacter sp. VNH31]MEE1885249.1 dihydrofolate reductase [Pedobacter sp. VNH31]